MKSPISTNSLKALRKSLPHGAIKTIAERLDMDESTVSRVLKGERNNLKVIEMALTVIDESRAKAAELENKIAAIS